MTRGMPAASIGPYLADSLGSRLWRDCTVTLIAGGRSNLTYRVASPAGQVVVRRPPLGHVLPTAHDMRREYTVLEALAHTDVPVPLTLAMCDEPAVLGAPFYVMTLVEGHVVRDVFPAGYADRIDDRREIGRALPATLARLHAVDPAAVGLATFGRPDGYLARQVRRWAGQWNATRLPDLGQVDALAAALGRSVPATQRSAVVHGDFRLENTILHPTEHGRIAAVLDWEMSTLGDPLADLGILLAYWDQADDGKRRTIEDGNRRATSLPGFPTRSEVADLYAAETGLDLQELPWAVAFAFFKLAVVCAGVVHRARGGSMLGDGFARIEDRIPRLAELGRASLADGVVY